MNLTRTGPVLDALRTHLNTVLPSRMTIEIDATTLTAGLVVVTPVTSPTLIYLAMAGPDKAHMLVQVTICDTTRTKVRLAGDLTRDALTAVDRRNQPLHPLTLADYTFDVPTTTGDGHALLDAGVHTWVETFAIVWQHRP